MRVPGCAPRICSRVIAFGEVLWDIFDDSKRLGGAPLNFVAHACRLGNQARLISCVGNDELGRQALLSMQSIGIGPDLIRVSKSLPTGAATVWLGDRGETVFRIKRPAAYDGIALRPEDLENLRNWSPDWLYYGSLVPYNADARKTLYALAGALPRCRKFYDLNLRPHCYSPEVVLELLQQADVVKLNESEMLEVAGFTGLHAHDIEQFCASGSARFGWHAVAVTLGDRGSAVWANGDYAQADARKIVVADAVGAGDGFAAAMVHGLSHGWSARRIAVFANQVGALIASRQGGIPDWSIDELSVPAEVKEPISPSA